MDNYFSKTNVDDIFLRSIIVGVINVLNEKINYINIKDGNKKVVNVPFFYNMGGQERFLQDYFLSWSDCNYNELSIDGNIDPIPRGIITLSDASINESNLTQKWINGNYDIIEDGILTQYSAYINSLPLDIRFNIVIKVNNVNELFKIFQCILDIFYKNVIIDIAYRGFRIPCNIAFPENYPINKSFEFSYPSDNEITLSFDLAIETYYPIVEQATNVDKSMQDFIIRPSFDDISYNIVIDNPNEYIHFCGDLLDISWKIYGNVFDNEKVNILFSYDKYNWDYIAKYVNINKCIYKWRIPEYINDDYIKCYIFAHKHVIKEANIRFFANNSGVIDKFHIIDGGYGYDDSTVIEFDNSTIMVNPVIKDGSIVDIVILNGGVGLPENKPKDIYIKIEYNLHGEKKETELYNISIY